MLDVLRRRADRVLFAASLTCVMALCLLVSVASASYCPSCDNGCRCINSTGLGGGTCTCSGGGCAGCGGTCPGSVANSAGNCLGYCC